MPSDGVSHTAAAMMARLYMSGAMAAIAKRWNEVSTLEQNVLTAKTAGEISRMRVRLATRSRNCASPPATYTFMIGRASSARMAEVTTAMMTNRLMTELVRCQ